MIAVGPIFPEEKGMVLHRPVRDQVAALEKGLAAALHERGYAVLGKHSCRREPDHALLTEIVRLLEDRLHEGTSA